MKKLNFALITICTLFIAQSILAQESIEARIGVVEMNKLVTESPQYQDMTSAIEEEFAARVRDITAKEAALNAATDQLNQDNLALSQDERNNTLLKLNADQRELKYLTDSFQEDRNNRIQIESNKIFVEIINSIEKYGRDNAFDLIINRTRISQNTILNGGTVFSGASVDITNEIARILEKKFQEDKAGG
tara:strand:- start:3512 stop:4081 length:570 start_codon:yes stop_codon:yes gene_type:complete